MFFWNDIAVWYNERMKFQMRGWLALVALTSACASACAHGGITTPDFYVENESDSVAKPDFNEYGGWSTIYMVLIDPAFSDADDLAIKQGFDSWANAVPVQFTYWVASCNESVAGQICVHKSPTQLLIDDAGQFGGILGSTSWSNANADINMHITVEPYGQDVFTWTVKHEAGHAMCEIHHPGHHIMNPYLLLSVESITADDANQYLNCRSFSLLPEDAGLIQDAEDAE
jgi:hypothetical protein